MKKEKKVYEAPELRVHQTLRTQMICASGQGGGGDVENDDGSRRFGFDLDED